MKSYSYYATLPLFYQLPTILLLLCRLTVCHSFVGWEQHHVSQRRQQPSNPTLEVIHHHPQQYRLQRSIGGDGTTRPTQQQQHQQCRRLYASIQEPPSIKGGVEDDDIDKRGDSSSIIGGSVLSGVEDFERWFVSVPGAKCDPSIRHDDFGNLRGLGYFGSKEGSSGGRGGGGGNQQRKEWMTIPRSIVVQSDFSQVDWDSRLAQTLWQEALKGKSSAVAGYTSLLLRGWTINDLPNRPPSTANDALRHWTDEEKSVLASTSSGRRLLDLQKQQEDLWRDKFRKINGMTWEQFEWAMEVVHSRAFCGDFGLGGSSSLLPPVVTIASPIVAAIAGYTYYVPLHGQNDLVLLGIGAVAALPLLINLVTQKPPVAVLLPLIDSANHREEVDSSIEYNPLTDSFNLVTGGANNNSQCIITEPNGKEQLYVSYGKKKDSELLLNYGFLRGVPTEGDTSSRRKQLATMFLRNNNDQ